MRTPAHLTLTVHTVAFAKGTGTWLFAKSESAVVFAQRYQDTWGEATITERTDTYLLGDRVEVHAHGAWRSGVIRSSAGPA